jgi:hypothetical protein
MSRMGGERRAVTRAGGGARKASRKVAVRDKGMAIARVRMKVRAGGSRISQ